MKNYSFVNEIKFDFIYHCKSRWLCLDKKEGFNLWLNDFVPDRLEDVLVEDLYIQRKNHHDSVLGKVEEKNSRWKISNGPLLEVLEMYLARGIEFVRGNFKQTLFFKLFNDFNTMRSNWDVQRPSKFYYVTLTEELIWNKFLSLIRLYEKFKKKPYISPPFEKSYVIVLDRPYRVLKNIEFYKINGYEIWSGHHRATVHYLLGNKKIKVLVASARERISG